MSLLPPERDAVLIVNPHAVSSSLVALQPLKPITGRNREVVESGGDVDRLELPLGGSPDDAWNSPSRPSVPFSKEIRGGLVGKRLDHTYYMLHG
jgi:hypothetical protein